jgi:tetratricopeptide (TPR) repeat protein
LVELAFYLYQNTPSPKGLERVFVRKQSLSLIFGLSCSFLAAVCAGKDKPAPAPVRPAPSFSDFKSAYEEGNKALKEGRMEDAVADYTAAEDLTDIPRRKSQVANAKGFALMKNRQWKEAKKAFDQAAKFDPANKVALNNSGFASSKMYQYGLAGVEALKDAVKRLEESSALDPAYKPEFLERAKADLAREESYAQATPVAAAHLKTMDYKSLAALGDKAQAQGQFELALRAFKQAEIAALTPKSKGAAANRVGKSLLDSRRPQEAVAHFERAVQYQPEEKVFLNNLGLSLWMLFDSGKGTPADLKKAVDCFYRGNSLDPSFHKENLTMALEKLREVDPQAAKAYNLGKEEGEPDETPKGKDKDTRNLSGQDSN